METLLVVPNQHVELCLGEDRTVQARVLDAFPDVLLLRVPGSLAAEDAPDVVELGFAHKSFYCHAVVAVRAYYSHAWFVEHPDLESARKVQRRRFVRIRIDVAVVALESSLYGEPLGSPFELRFENISAGGCLANTDRPQVGDYLMIFLTLLDTDGEVVIGRVMQRRQRPEGGLSLGIAFDSFAPGKQDQLAHQINREIQLNLQAGRDITV